jgi:hypothetical protein
VFGIEFDQQFFFGLVFSGYGVWSLVWRLFCYIVKKLLNWRPGKDDGFRDANSEKAYNETQAFGLKVMELICDLRSASGGSVTKEQFRARFEKQRAIGFGA